MSEQLLSAALVREIVWGTSELKTVVVGLGNSLRTDDGVGLIVARSLAESLKESGAAVFESTACGLDVLDYLCGYERAILTDAVQTENAMPGDVFCFDLPCSSRHLLNPHSADLSTALEIGRVLNMPLPSSVIVVGIQTADTVTFGESCTPRVEASIPLCKSVILDLIAGNEVPRGICLSTAIGVPSY